MDPKVVVEEVVENRKLPELKQLKSALKHNEVVNTPIARMDKSILKAYKAKQGRKRKFTPTKMKNAINGYFDYCETEDRVPSIKGLMIHLNMYRDQFYQYLAYPEFKDIMEHARIIISEWCENDVYKTKGQASAKIAYMKNIHNWTERIETDQVITEVLTPDSAKAKIEMLAPKLLEILKTSNLLNQLIPQEGVQEVQEATFEKPSIPNLGLVRQNSPGRL
jgi:hypothetical protein